MQDSSTDPRVTYAEALAAAADDLDDALLAIRDETAAGRVTPAEAAKERVELLTRHLEHLEQLRTQYLGES